MRALDSSIAKKLLIAALQKFDFNYQKCTSSNILFAVLRLTYPRTSKSKKTLMKWSRLVIVLNKLFTHI